MEKDDGSNGLNRETKKKLSPLRILDKAQVEQVIHRIGKEAQSGSAQSAGLKDKVPKGDKARKANSVKGMKAVAHARAGYTTLICVAGEKNKKECSQVRSKVSSASSHMMGQVDAVAMSEKGQVTVSHISTPSLAGEFLFAAVAMSEMGQVRRESTGVNSGDRSGCKASNLNWEYGLGQHKDQGVEGGQDDRNDSLVGCLGNKSGGHASHGADQMDLEGGGDGWASQ